MKPLKLSRVQVVGPKPKERSGHRIVSDDDGVIYSFGGWNPGSQNLEQDNNAIQKSLFKELWRFDPIRKEWTLLETTGQHPEQVASHAAVYMRNHLIVYGGTGYPFGHTSTNRIFSCNLKTLEWSQLTPSNPPNCHHLPAEMYGQAIVADPTNDCIYVVGGTTGFTYSIDVHKFDLTTRRWTELYRKTPYDESQFPAERYRHELALFDDKIYVFGGGNTSNVCALINLPVFDLKSNTWIKVRTRSEASTFPSKRKCHGCVVTKDNNVYVFGGNKMRNTDVLKDIWRFNLLTCTWTPIEVTLKRPLFFFGITITPADRVYIFGGVCQHSSGSSSRINEMYEIWLSVPPLHELAWQTVLDVRSQSKEEKISSVQSLGLPKRFLDRINCDGSESTCQLTTWQPPPSSLL